MAGEQKERVLFLHPSGGIEPALNGFSRELVGKGKTGERERERQTEKGREGQGKEVREEERESSWSV